MIGEVVATALMILVVTNLDTKESSGVRVAGRLKKSMAGSG